MKTTYKLHVNNNGSLFHPPEALYARFFQIEDCRARPGGGSARSRPSASARRHEKSFGRYFLRAHRCCSALYIIRCCSFGT